MVGVSRKSLAAEAFGGGKRLKRGRAGSAFNVVEDLGSSDRSRAVFLYSELTGELAYNANGSGRGLAGVVVSSRHCPCCFHSGLKIYKLSMALDGPWLSLIR